MFSIFSVLFAVDEAKTTTKTEIPTQINSQEEEGEEEDYSQENWRGLIVNYTVNKRKKPFYSTTIPEILYTKEGKKITVGILKNGNTFKNYLLIDKQKFYFTNTCCIDSILQAVACAYCDSTTYKNFLIDDKTCISILPVVKDYC